MQAAKMASLFNVDIDNSLEETENKPAGSFNERVDDVKAILHPAPETQSDNDLIKTALKDVHKKSTVTQPVLRVVDDPPADLEIPGDVIEKVASDIENFQKTILEKEDVKENLPPLTGDNPLSLTGADLKAYHAIKQQYADKFSLFDGSLAYRDFYQYKVHALRHLLTQFPLLDIQEMREELRSIHTNHFIGDDVCTPDVIRVKLDASYSHRTRLSSLLTAALEQVYAWERFLDMLRAKLWKDHDIGRGAHKRDGMTIEHLSDIESYVANLLGFIESARQYDSMLRAAADSLSRQLTCLQMSEYELTQRVDGDHSKAIRKTPRSSKLDSFDGMDDGTVISAPVIRPNSAVTTVNYGVEDEISVLG